MTAPTASAIASVRQRLLNRARDRQEDFQLTLVRYGVERFLFRLSQSAWAERYVVKGATLFEIWLDQPHRATRDLDFTWLDPGTQEQFAAQLRDVCAVECPEDGLVFDLSELRIAPIRLGQEVSGVRARFRIFLGSARIDMRLDVGAGDVVTPPPELVDFPTLLDHPAPRVRTYRRETVIAEKMEAMVSLGETNSRYKDFSDIALLALHTEFHGPTLRSACADTFERRATPLKRRDRPAALSSAFYEEDQRSRSWNAFARENRSLEKLGSFLEVGKVVTSFLAPVWEELTRTAADEERSGRRSQIRRWQPPGPWSMDESGP